MIHGSNHAQHGGRKGWEFLAIAWLSKNQGALEGLTVAQRAGVE